MINLKGLRTELGLTQLEMAEKVGCSQGSLSFIEAGKRAMPIELYAEIKNTFGEEMVEKYISFEEVANQPRATYLANFLNSNQNCFNENSIAENQKTIETLRKTIETLDKTIDHLREELSCKQKTIDELFAMLNSKK